MSAEARSIPLPLRRAAPAAQERRRHRRVAVSVEGRLLDSFGRELACRSLDISPGGARLTTADPNGPADVAVIWFDGLGRTPARLVRREACGASAVTFAASPIARDRLAERLTWLINAPALGLMAETPPAARAGIGGVLTAELEDGGKILVKVRDCSLQGATLACATAPAIGTWLRVGMSWGKVSAQIEGGVTVDFAPRPR